MRLPWRASWGITRDPGGRRTRLGMTLSPAAPQRCSPDPFGAGLWTQDFEF